jgi:hypothetical protein
VFIWKKVVFVFALVFVVVSIVVAIVYLVPILETENLHPALNFPPKW